MSKSLETRLAQIARAVSWKMTTFTDGHGRTMSLPTNTLLDAWLTIMLDQVIPPLDPPVARFLATAKVPQNDGDMVLVVVDTFRRGSIERPEAVAPQQMTDKDDEMLVEAQAQEISSQDENLPAPTGVPVARTQRNLRPNGRRQ